VRGPESVDMERGFISRCVSLWVRGCCPAAPTHTLSLPSCFSDLCQAEVPVLEGDLQPLTTTSNSSGYSSAVLDSTSRRHVAPVSGYTGVGGGVPVQVCRGMRGSPLHDGWTHSVASNGQL
jgi:hypothetical protein